MSMTRKQVLVQLNEELVARLDALSRETGRNRSDLAREALADLLDRFSEEAIDRQYVRAYSTTPPDVRLDAEMEALSREQARYLNELDGGW